MIKFQTNSRAREIGPLKSHRSLRNGISLLEVVLALAILAVASAYLAQSMQVASFNAARAESQTQAEIVSESIMNQVVAGAISTQNASWVPYSNPNPFSSLAASTMDSQWLYMVSTMSTEVNGMICVQVGVKEIIPGQSDDGQIEFYLNRWIIDPSLGLDTPPTTTSDTSTGGSSSGTSSTTTGATGSSTGGVQ